MAALPSSIPTLKPALRPAKDAGRPSPRKRLLSILVAAGLLGIAVAGVVLATHWPFREAAIIKALEKAGSGKVEIKNFRETYFPYPGCVAEGVTYRLGPGAPVFATVDRLTIQSNLTGFWVGRLRLIRAEGLHVYVPEAGAKQKFSGLSSGSTGIDEIEIRDAVLTVPRKEKEKASLEFGIHELRLEAISMDRAIRFSAALSNPEPRGEITAEGRFGPWKGVHTPVEGNYKFKNADLGPFEGIAGILSSDGKFDGELQHINVSGIVKIPDFELKSSKHAVPLNSEFDAYVDGVNGDTFLNRVASHFPKTTVVSEGKIVGVPGQKGETATIDLAARDGRIEDILRLFTKDPKPPMAGEVDFKGRAILPPGETRFLKKVLIEGDFGISDSNFTRPTTQEKVDQLSQSAQKEAKEQNAKKTGDSKTKDNGTAPPVLSELKGHVVVKNGTATFSGLSFYIPGAHALMHGTYNLISQQINMHGTLKMDSDLSDTAHGAKAVILKVLDPFFKKKHGKGSDVPVKVSGSYRTPSFGMDVGSASKRLVSGKK